MNVGKQFTIVISYEELLEWSQREMPTFKIDEILTADGAHFDKDGNLLIEVSTG